MLRPPRKLDQCGRVRAQKQIGTDSATEAVDCRGIYGDSVFKGSFQLTWHDRHIMLFSIDITEGQSDEFDRILLDKLYHFFRRVLHDSTCFR